MHPSPRARALLILTAVLALSVPVLAVTAPAATARAVDPGHAAAKQLLDKVSGLLAVKNDARTAPRTTPLPRTDLTVALQQLKASRGALNRSERAQADALLARPAANTSASCTGGAVIATQHFCVRYTRPNLLNPGTTDAWARTTADTLEYVYAQEVGGLGYRAPLNDGDGRLDVYLQNLGPRRLYGYCATGGSGQVSTAYCALDNDFSQAEYGANPLYSLRVTAAHEFFHAIQFAYNAYQDVWLMEGTAVWMEDQVYPTANDYYQYLGESNIAKPTQSTDTTGTIARYGAVTFWKFLSERFRDVGIIKQVWNYAAVSAGSRNALQSVLAVLNYRKASFPLEFGRYGMWNTLGPGTYADRAHYPKPGYVGAYSLGSGSRDTGWRTFRLDHLATAPLLYRPVGVRAGSRLRIAVDAPPRARGSQAWVQVRLRNGRMGVVVLPLDANGNAAKAFQFNSGVLAVVVTLTNASGGWNGQAFSVRARLV